MGAMKNLKLAQMELMEKYAAKIVAACLEKASPKRAEKVAALLQKCGFDADSWPEAVDMVKSNVKEIRKAFELVADMHEGGMKTKWREPFYDQLTTAVEQAERLLETYLGFSTNMDTLSMSDETKYVSYTVKGSWVVSVFVGNGKAPTHQALKGLVVGKLRANMASVCGHEFVEEGIESIKKAKNQ